MIFYRKSRDPDSLLKGTLDCARSDSSPVEGRTVFSRLCCHEQTTSASLDRVREKCYGEENLSLCEADYMEMTVDKLASEGPMS